MSRLSVKHLDLGDIEDKMPKLTNMEKQIEQLKEDIAEMILLESQPEAVSTYGMSYEETAELPYRSRL